MIEGITLRRATPEDYAFMRQLYGTSRADELESYPFTAEQKEAFLDHQFAAQSQHYAQHYPTARFDIIEKGGRAIGRFYVDVWESEIRVVDIAILPEFQKAGIGSALMTSAMEEGRASGKPVTIHVEMYNPALHLYERLGFRRADTNGVYLLMKWQPD
jgi:ribosomal protein S18 acetylase RimI-like enzyme